jgi:GNAT superfamily N-acetyltransferase
MRGGVELREATPGDELAVRRVLDAAMLASDAVDDAVARGDALVAVDDDRVVGALVLVPSVSVEYPDAVAPESDGMHVDAVAVRRRRRGQGIGRALVEAALMRARWLTVAYDVRVAEFYDALGFDVVAERDDRRWAVRSVEG